MYYFFCCRDGFWSICQARTQGSLASAGSLGDHVLGDGLLAEGILICTITAYGLIA